MAVLAASAPSSVISGGNLRASAERMRVLRLLGGERRPDSIIEREHELECIAEARTDCPLEPLLGIDARNRFLPLTIVRVRTYSYCMRYSLEHKAENHEKILSTAARSFREHGGDSSGIGRVMKKVGLAKGGFYRHFGSKDDLFVDAVARAFDEMGRGMVEVAKISARRSSSAGHDRKLSEHAPREFARNGLRVRRPRARVRAKAVVGAKAD